ncbi:MAG: hypothetical protein K9I94_10190 [Bacteroidales bacterium]|nr:hypothetical protein [Bacteroidales bacterium]
MKPVKGFVTISRWIMRLALLLFFVLNYGETVLDLNFNEMGFYLSSLFFLFGVLLFVGGFLKEASLTVTSGLVLSILVLYQIIVTYPGAMTESLASKLLLFSVTLYFFASGNNKI